VWAGHGQHIWTSGVDSTLRRIQAATGHTDLIVAICGEETATIAINEPGKPGRIIEATSDAWRWIQWSARGPDGVMDVLPMTYFGAAPEPKSTPNQ